MTINTGSLLGGTDGFRGTYTEELGPGHMNSETFAGLSYALVQHQQMFGHEGPVVIARDTRRSGEVLGAAAIAGVELAGAEVVYCDVLPTPAAQKFADGIGAMATIVATASHNPAADNGWKGMIGSRKPDKAEVQAISDRFWKNHDSGLIVPHKSLADVSSEAAQARTEYIKRVVGDIEQQFGNQPLTGRLFVLDMANGAASDITPEVFVQLGAEITTIATGAGEINDGYGAADLRGLRTFLENNPQITNNPNFVGALANDGDADRVMAMGVAAKGKLVTVDGNHVMELMARHPRQPGIVGTMYTNSGLRQRLNEESIAFEECDNGDVYVTNALRATKDWRRGGEFTGHIIDLDWLGSGDGVRTAAWLAALASQKDMTFGDIYDSQPMWPEVMTKVRLQPGQTVDTALPELQDTIGAMQQDGMHIVVRASGTEPIVRVFASAAEEEHAVIANKGLQQLVGRLVTARAA